MHRARQLETVGTLSGPAKEGQERRVLLQEKNISSFSPTGRTSRQRRGEKRAV
jgi:hypothetical protein